VAEAKFKGSAHFTYDDYLTWPNDQRWELVNGRAYAMASPSTRHQTIAVRLTATLDRFFRNGRCRLFAAPLDVVLSEDTVVQPDLLVVCNPERILDGGIKGAPDLAVEILSPSSCSYDRFLKFKRYAEAGVAEYWIVTPEQASIEVYSLSDGTYRLSEGYLQQETLTSVVFPGLSFGLSEVFEVPPEGVPVRKTSDDMPRCVREKLEL
jgi:Uma2 family endonuclease